MNREAYLERRHREFPQPPARVIFGLFIAVALLQFPAGYFIREISVVWGILINQIGIMLLLPLIGIKIAGYNPKHLLPFGKSESIFLFASIVLTFGGAIFLSYLQTFSEFLSPTTDAMRSAIQNPLAVSSALDFFLKMSLICFLAPICEEIFFRGFIQRTFSLYVGTNYAVLITAVFFAFMHPSAWHTHLYFLLGLILSFIASRTRTLRAPIICHMLNNTYILLTSQMGVYFPLENEFGRLDLSLFSLSILLIITGIWVLNKSRRRA